MEKPPLPLIKHKDDVETVQKLRALGYPAIAPALPFIMQWMQDANWPVAGPVSQLLKEIGEPIIPEIRRVLLLDDDTWKYWCLNLVEDMEVSVAKQLLLEIGDILLNPTESEKSELVFERAGQLFDQWTHDPTPPKAPEIQADSDSAAAETLKSGYTMCFSGVDFDPDEFLKNSKLKPDVVSRRGEKIKGRTIEESALIFDDIREGKYRLDPTYEAIDLLEIEIEEFTRLSKFPGVTNRTLTVFGSADCCSTDLKPSQINILHCLEMELSIGSYW